MGVDHGGKVKVERATISNRALQEGAVSDSPLMPNTGQWWTLLEKMYLVLND